MSTKHTPGPWEMMPSALEGANSKRIFADAGYVATVGASDQEWSEVVANARLIAAAPELLDACKALLCMLDRGGEPRKIDEALTWRENDEKARKMAVDAIRKATGE